MATHDPNAAKRATIESCLTCRFFFPSPKCHETGGKGAHVTGDCRRNPPATGTDGHPTTYVYGWCGEYKHDTLKTEHLKALDAEEKKNAQEK